MLNPKAIPKFNRIELLSSPRRAVLLLLAVVLLTLWGVTAAMVMADHRRTERAAGAELLGAIPVLKLHARRSFDTAHAILVALDESLQIAGDHFDLDRLSLLALKIQGDESDDPIGIAIIDANERLMQIEGNRSSVFVGDRDYMQAIRGKPPGELYIGTQLVSRASGRSVIPVVMMARPNPSGVLAILAAIPVESFEDAYKNLLISAPSTIGLIRHDGILLHMTPDPNRQTGQRLKGYDFDEISKIYPPQTVFDHPAIEPGAVERKSSYARVESYPLIVFASMRRDFLRAAWYQLAWPKLVAAVAGSIVLSLFAVWIMALMGRRDAAMTRVTEALIELDAANRAKRDFMARMSHELRTPLNAIIGFSELISGAMVGPLAKTYQDYGRDIHRSGAHLLDMINQVLDITRIETGSLHPKAAPVDIDAVSNEVGAILRPLAEARQVAMRFDIAADASRLSADPMMLRQMLLNLMSNAVKFSPPGEAVTVQSTVEEDSILLRVADRGAGIAKDKLQHLFEPFGSGQSMLAQQAAGIGLGLPIAKKLVEMHGGRLTITTGRNGTVVTLVFPAERRVAA